jgi:hypothetical protein
MSFGPGFGGSFFPSSSTANIAQSPALHHQNIMSSPMMSIQNPIYNNSMQGGQGDSIPGADTSSHPFGFPPFQLPPSNL